MDIFVASTQTMASIFDRNNFQSKQNIKYPGTTGIGYTTFSIKEIDFLPNSDQLYGCFNDNSIHIWANYNFQLLKYIQPIKAREIYLKKSNAITVDLKLMRKDVYHGSHADGSNDDNDDTSLEILLKSITKDFSSGLINAICFSQTGRFMSVSTIDDYIILFATETWEIDMLIETPRIAINQCIFVPHQESIEPMNTNSNNNRGILAVITSLQNTLLIDLNELNVKSIEEKENQSKAIAISKNGLMMSIVLQSGEVFVYNLQLLLNKMYEKQASTNVIKDEKEKHEQHYNWINNEVSFF